MELIGNSIIAGEVSDSWGSAFSAYDPKAETEIGPLFYEASEGDIKRAGDLGADAFKVFRWVPQKRRGDFLISIKDKLTSISEDLLARCSLETGLPMSRLESEFLRTVNQISMFADLLYEGSWVEARIDRGQPGRKPLPKPDVRQMRIPLGPVAVFGASNFPLAFSVPGGDTISAFAAGCPVIVKAHPSHPGTSEMVARAINEAVREGEFPGGIFSLLQGRANSLSISLVTHPEIKAAGFTGSFSAGKAIYNAAVSRNEPIPVYAEMGSVNPLFLLPEAVKDRSKEIASGLAGSVTLGTGQFCTKPGLVFFTGPADYEKEFCKYLNQALEKIPAGILLSQKIKNTYLSGINSLSALKGVEFCRVGPYMEGASLFGACALKVPFNIYKKHKEFQQEIFGPVLLLIIVENEDELLEAVGGLNGQLTATFHASGNDIFKFERVIGIAQERAGRIIFNGFPTGVEVGPAMHHGGPYPATTDSSSTSVGTLAIRRFSRPICFQNAPGSVLPPELRDDNPLKLFRMIDGNLSRDGI